MKYRADIDGLRAIAVLAVILYHAGLSFPGGYVGVDVFFVISGYLITGILVKEIKAGSFTFPWFWKRRVLRLLPALAVMSLVTGIAGYWILMPSDLKDLAGALIAQPFLLANVYFWQVINEGYFGDPAEKRPLLHTWSLNIEEQFYLLFPLLLLYLCRRKYVHKKVLDTLTLICGGSFALSVILTPQVEAFAYFTLLTRAWELAMGGLLVYQVEKPIAKGRREALAWLGLGLVSYSIFFYDDDTLFPGWAALVPCLGTALLILAGSSPESTFLSRKILSNAVPVVIGRASYSLYLWHWPLISYAKYVGLNEHRFHNTGVLLATAVLGFLSWRFIERPFLARKGTASNRFVLGIVAVYVVSCAGLGGVYWQKNGIPESWSEQAIVYITAIEDRWYEFNLDLGGFGEQKFAAIGATSQSPAFVLWGDSHAQAYMPAIDQLSKQLQKSTLVVTTIGTPPVFDCPIIKESERVVWENAVMEALAQAHPPVVILSARWEMYQGKFDILSALKATVRRFQEKGVTVVVLLDTASMPYNVPRMLALLERTHHRLPAPQVDPKERYAFNHRVRAELDGIPNVTILDPEPFLVKDGQCLISLQGRSLYRDPDHISITGALFLAPMFDTLKKFSGP